MTVMIIIEVALFGFFLASDLLTKHFICPFLIEEGGTYTVIDKVLTFIYSENDGAGFGVFSGKQTLLIAITSILMLVLLGVLVFAHCKKMTKQKGGSLMVVALLMLIGGGIGNLVDRIAFGYVRDFIDYTFLVTLFDYQFAICNVADIWCTVGVVLLVIYIIFFFGKTEKTEKKTVEDSTAEISIASDDENIITSSNGRFEEEATDGNTCEDGDEVSDLFGDDNGRQEAEEDDWHRKSDNNKLD